jgi:cytoskeleton protein RodZ
MIEPGAPPELFRQPQAPGPGSAGTLLRQAREGAGVDIGALAAALKVPVGKLEALEADRVDLLPDAVFARALAASVCRILKIDPEQVLALLPGKTAPSLPADTRLGNASFERTQMGWQMPLLSRVPRSVLAIVALLVLAALVLIFVPSLTRLKPMLEQWASRTSASDLGSKSEALPSVGEHAAADPPGATLAPPMVPPETHAAAATTVTAAPTAPAASQAAIAASGAALAATSALLVLKTRADSWVQVLDAAGTVQLRKTMASGETATVAGQPPLAVTIGRAASTEVLVRGKPFDLAAVSKDNVARFEVK